MYSCTWAIWCTVVVLLFIVKYYRCINFIQKLAHFAIAIFLVHIHWHKYWWCGIFCTPYLKLGGKSFCKTWFEVGMELKKVQKQGRDESTQEDYPTTAKIHIRSRVTFLRSFISALFLYFFNSIPTWNQVLQKLFSPSFCSFFGGF